MTTTAPAATCIIADDDPAIRAFVARVLLREQFDVLPAASGREALSLLAAHPCDILVIDLAMPDGDGMETIRAVRSQYTRLKILVVSGRFGGDILRTAEYLGADASLPKPFSPDALVTAVRRLLEVRT